MIKFLLAMMALAVTTTSAADTYTLKDPKRLISVIDVVDGDILEKTRKLERLSRESNDPITLLINSPGGQVHVGFLFVQAMRLAKARGVRLECVSGVLAASMAYIMLAECDERIVMENTLLLFHPISSGGRFRVGEQMPSLRELTRFERRVNHRLIRVMGMSAPAYYAHRAAETLWTGQGLYEFTRDAEFLRVVDRIEGFDKLFIHTRPRGLFFERRLELIPEPLRYLYAE